MKPVLNIALHSCLSLFLFLSAYGLQRGFSTMESSNSHNKTREASDYEVFLQRCLLSPAFVCVRAHILCQCRTECISYSLCLYLSVFACPSVCGGWWQHTRCPLSRGSTVNISKQRTCWRALTLSTPLNSIHPSVSLYACMLHICLSSAGQL